MRPNQNEPVRAITVSPAQVGLKLEELLDGKAVAKLLGVSTAASITWACERQGPHSEKTRTRRGSRVYYQRCEVEAWLSKHAVRIEMKD